MNKHLTRITRSMEQGMLIIPKHLSSFTGSRVHVDHTSCCLRSVLRIIACPYVLLVLYCIDCSS